MNYLNITKGALLAGITLISTLSFAQKRVETDAVLAFGKSESAQQTGDLVEAKKQILKAKESIDIAAANPETEKSPKTLFYKGEIYTTMLIFKMIGNDAEFNKSVPDDAKDIATKAYKESFTLSTKYHDEIKTSVGNIQQALYATGKAAFEAKKYKIAESAFIASTDFNSAINVIDTMGIYYAGLSAENDTNWVKAAEYYKRCADLNYMPNEIFKMTALAYIKGGKNEKAIDFLKQAIAKSPKDKYLYFAWGSIAIDMKDDDAVIQNLNKAVEIDPNYADAHYNLGVYFSGKGLVLREKASNLPANATKESNELLDKSLEFYRLAMDPLEKYIAIVPNDTAVLTSLMKIARALKMPEKEAKYKQLLDAAK
jgi:tetratricopeptide (TPR) repeat protein